MKKILVIDDSPDIVKVLCEYLANMGYGVNFLVKPKFLMKLLEKERYDLILVDFNMPEMNGVDVLKTLKESSLYRDIPVIMISGVRDEKLIEKAFEFGAVDYITKPVQQIELKARVESVLRLQFEQSRYANLLGNIFPAKVCEELLQNGYYKPRFVEQATIGFTDFCGFTKASQVWKPDYLIEKLNLYFCEFDLILRKYGAEKIKTLGDGYLFGCGISEEEPLNPQKCAKAALDILDFVTSCQKQHREGHLDFAFDIRIGLHTGSIVSGVIGRDRFAYDVWGDTVNTAKLIEANGQRNTVNISEATFSLIHTDFPCKKTGEVSVKTKGMIPFYCIENTLITSAT